MKSARKEHIATVVVCVVLACVVVLAFYSTMASMDEHQQMRRQVQKELEKKLEKIWPLGPRPASYSVDDWTKLNHMYTQAIEADK